MMKTILFLITIILLSALGGCKKGFLDAKPDKALVVPSSLGDLNAILNNTDVMNSSYGGLASVASDEYYVPFNVWNSRTTPSEKNAYVWAEDIYENELLIFDWKFPFQVVFYSNLVSVLADQISVSPEQRINVSETKAKALYYRSWAYHLLANLYCKTYDPLTAETDRGLPLRDDYDVNISSDQASLEDTYTFMIDGLLGAWNNLPGKAMHPTVPTKPAALALLSRLYLAMGNYDSALEYAEMALNLKNDILDFNELDNTQAFPFPIFNQEVIFHSAQLLPSIIAQQNARIDTSLFDSFSDNDLRKQLFFRKNADGTMLFRGSFTGSNFYFNGITVGELFLNKAECLARLDRTKDAKVVLGQFMEKRYSGTLPPLNENTILFHVLEERKKEMLFRGTRWMDIKRLNLDPQTSVVLNRNLNGDIYRLEPLSERYVFPIPTIVTDMWTAK